MSRGSRYRPDFNADAGDPRGSRYRMSGGDNFQ